MEVSGIEPEFSPCKSDVFPLVTIPPIKDRRGLAPHSREENLWFSKPSQCACLVYYPCLCSFANSFIFSHISSQVIGYPTDDISLHFIHAKKPAGFSPNDIDIMQLLPIIIPIYNTDGGVHAQVLSLAFAPMQIRHLPYGESFKWHQHHSHSFVNPETLSSQ